jgi:hypothetical protein
VVAVLDSKVDNVIFLFDNVLFLSRFGQFTSECLELTIYWIVANGTRIVLQEAARKLPMPAFK